MSEIDPTLTRTDWTEAGIEVIAAGQALTLAALCARVGASKGSFYWHFKTLKDLRRAVSTAYRARAEARLHDPLPLDGPHPPLLQLMVVMEVSDEAEAALRRMAAEDAAIAADLDALSSARLARIGAELDAMGRGDPNLPMMVYAAWLGAPQVAALSGLWPGRIRMASARRIAR